jgi:6-phosphogluconolactonase
MLSIGRVQELTRNRTSLTPTLLSPGGTGFYYAVDLGTDRLWIYRLDFQRGKLIPAEPPWVQLPPGTGPRHLSFHPHKRFAYTINEPTSTVTFLRVDGRSGALIPEQTISTLPIGYDEDNQGGEVQIEQAGQFLYATNRGHNSIAIFEIDQVNGRLTLIGHQSTYGRGP